MNEINKNINEFIDKVDKNIDNLIDYLDLKDLIILLLILIIISLLLYFSLNYWFNLDSSELYFDDMAIYYINLDRSFDRRISIEKMCKMHDIKSERVQGIDGKLLNLDDPKYEKALKKNKMVVSYRK